MNICSDDHDEVCYEGRTCPVCYIKEDLQTEITELQKVNSDLESDINKLEYKLSEIEEVVDEAKCSKLMVKRVVNRILGKPTAPENRTVTKL